MAISDTQKTDFLWKKVIFGATNTSTNGKQGFEEAIGSKLPVFAGDIMAEPVPVTPPNVTTSVLRYHGTTSALQMTADPTVAGNRSWFATSTFGTLTSRVGDWIPTSIDPGYLVEVYKNDPTVPANKLNQGTSNNEWVFDYQAGVLTFVNTIPAGITSLWLVGHRYIGRKGLGGAGVNIRVNEATYNGVTVSSGNYTVSNFFTYTPQVGTIEVSYNGLGLALNDWSVSGKDLIINLDSIPYDLEAGDVLSAHYGFAG